MLFQLVADLFKLGEGVRHLFFKFVNRFGEPDAGHNVLSLGVGKEVTFDILFTGGGIAGHYYTGG